MDEMNRTVVILCPGPSLKGLTRADIGDPLEIIAVNSALDAPAAEGCDWWCAHDLWKPPLVLPTRAPRKGMVTCGAAIRDGQANYVPYPLHDFGRVEFAEPVRVSTSMAVYWATWRLMCLGYYNYGKEWAKCGRIRLYGCDMKGTGHWNDVDDHLWTDDQWSQARDCLRKAVSICGVHVEGLPW